MLIKLSEEELDFVETLYNSTAMAEILFSDYDNLSSFKGEKLAHLRLGQVPLLSHEYLIAENPKLTEKENFQLKKGAGDIYVMGGRLFGKCEYENSWCLLSNGKREQYKNLIGTTQKVISLNQNNWKLEISEAKFYNNGIKNCIKLILSSGKEITITENHPLLTQDGWKKTKEIKINDFIATPKNYKNLGKKNVNENLSKLLGYLIGDGCCINGVNWANINKELIEEFYEIVDFFNCSIRKKGIGYHIKKKNYQRSKYIKGKGYQKGYQHDKNNIQKIVEKYEINKLSKNKEIPKEVFTWENKYIALLLNRLYACDGSIGNNNIIEITLASEKLIKDIQHLLLRFGIHSNIYKKVSKLNGKNFPSWRLFITGYKNSENFIKKIGIKSKDYKFKEKKLNFSTANLIPNKFYYNIKNLLNGFRKKLKTRKFKLYNVSLEKWKRLAKIVKKSEIDKIVYSDIYWEKVKKIKFIKNLKTVAVSVPKNNTYISNDIISHNSLFVEKVDLLISMILNENEKCGFSSYDAIHIRGILEDVILGLDHHPLFRIFKPQITRSPNYRIGLRNGYLLEGVNMNITGKKPGAQFFQKHFSRLYIEERSFETLEVYKQRRDSVSENGCIFRISGMTNFTRYSPPGKDFYDLDKRIQNINLPQYSNPKWDSKAKEKAIKDFGGEQTIGFRVFIKGEIVEEGVSVFDMERVRQNYNEKRILKIFEINKENFKNFKNIIVIERPKNADNSYVFADIGESAPSEIGIIFEINKKYRYSYNITLYNLTDKEQFKVFEWIAREVKVNFLSLDCTDGTGRAIFRSLEEVIPKENLVWVSFNEKLCVGFEKDEKDNIKYDKTGKPIPREEYVSEWSILHLKDLFYTYVMDLPIDHKLDSQLNSVICIQSGKRTIYECVLKENHLFQAFQVFSIAQWLNVWNIINSVSKKKFCKSGV